MAVTIGPVAIAASADDASELATTVVSITANPLANCDTAGVWNAWRFVLPASIPANAVITSAKLTLQFTSSTLDEPEVTISGLDVATPAVFAAVNADISGRARTTATVNWSNTNAGTSDVDTSDISAIVQELVNSYSYGVGAIMGFVFTTTSGSATRDTSVRSYDNSTTLCCRLTITYQQDAAITEAATATETEGATLTQAGVISESSPATEVTANTLETQGVISESSPLTDITDGLRETFASISEGAAASDISDASFEFLVAITESASVAEVESAFLEVLGAIVESGSATDSQVAVQETQATITESVAATENQSATKETQGTISEPVSASELVDNTIQRLANQAESASASELQSATLGTLADLTEGGNAIDSLIAQLQRDGIISEGVAASDSQDATITPAGGDQIITEAATASDEVSALLTTLGIIVEATPASDVVSGDTIIVIPGGEIIIGNSLILHNLVGKSLVSSIDEASVITGILDKKSLLK